MVEAAGVEPLGLTGSTEVIVITHSHDSLNAFKWAIHYTSITRERIRSRMESFNRARGTLVITSQKPVSGPRAELEGLRITSALPTNNENRRVRRNLLCTL